MAETSAAAMADKIKITLAGLLLISGLVGFYYFSTQPLVLRVAMVLVGVGLGVAVGWLSEPGRQLAAFAHDAIEETKKVVWPTRKESFQTAAAVFAFVAVMALFLWLVDKGLELGLYDLVLGWKRS
jgi:preprotein translocase subunit SecE